MAKRYQIDYGHDGDPVREAIRKLDGNIEDLYEEVDDLGASTETPASIKSKYEENPDTNAYSNAEKTKLAGIEAGAQANEVSRADLAGKVDKVAGMGLSQESYTTAEKTKLAGVEAGAQSNPGEATADAPGLMSAADKAKLDGVETSAQVNPGEATANSAGLLSAADKTKLDGVQAGAQTNAVSSVAGKTGDVAITKADVGLGSADDTSDADKPVSTATQTALNGKVDKAAGMGLSQESYTTAEKTKLAGMENAHFRGEFPNLGALSAVTGSTGDYAYVDLGAGEDVVTYIWDTTDGAWVPQTGSSGSETPASIKSKYEANPDTNAYSDAEKTKLAGIAAGAQVNEVGRADLTSKVDKVAGMGLSQESYTATEKTKLAGIEAGAQVNEVSRADLANKVDKVAGMGLSQESYTATEKTKLAGLGGTPDLSGYQPKSEKGQPGGYAELDEDGKVPLERMNLPNTRTLHQIDLQLAGKFAGITTNAALEASKDFAVWGLESATVKYIKVRCAAADSGATPCSVQLVVNGVPVGSAVQAIASSWTVQAQTGVTLHTGDEIEIAVVDTGTNKDSEWLRFTFAAEV